jgi:hypothetical protein
MIHDLYMEIKPNGAAHKITVHEFGSGAFLSVHFRKSEQHEWEEDSHVWLSSRHVAELARVMKDLSDVQLEHIADYKRKKAEIHGPPRPKKAVPPIPEWLERHPLFG